MRFNGQVLKELRENRNWSISDLHREIIRGGVTLTTAAIYALEGGEVRFPQSRTLKALAAVFGVEETVFFVKKPTLSGRVGSKRI